MTNTPLILISNDDGIHAEGLKSLYESVKHLGDVFVVAPADDQSATGLAVTYKRPLKITQVGENYFSVDGTSTDCVKLAINCILPRSPDLILSGINGGSNAGRNVLYSGTAAVVIEGALRQIPGIAFSCCDFYQANYADILKYVVGIVDYSFVHSLPSGTFLNVNFPPKSLGSIKGIHLTKQGKEYLMEKPEKREHPFANDPYYWLGAQLASFEEEDDCDVSWLKKGFATVVPIHVGDLTHLEFAKQRESFKLHHAKFI